MNKNNIEIIIVGFASIDIFKIDNSISKSDNTNEFLAVPGGSSANVAVDLSKLGVKTGLIGKLGQDMFGDILIETLEKYNVNTEGIVFTEEVRTPLVFISKKDKKKVLFYRNPGSDMKLQKGDIKKALFEKAFIFHFDSVSLTDEPELSAIYQALDYARYNNQIISFDVNYRKVLWKDRELALSRINKAIKAADLIKLNSYELRFVSGEEDINKGINRILEISDKIRMVVVTDGDKGSYIRIGKSFKHVNALDIPVVETTGCGDSFMAAFLSRILEILKKGSRLDNMTNESLEKILLYSNAAGAITSSKYGVIPVLPTKNELADFLDSRGLMISFN